MAVPPPPPPPPEEEVDFGSFNMQSVATAAEPPAASEPAAETRADEEESFHQDQDPVPPVDFSFNTEEQTEPLSQTAPPVDDPPEETAAFSFDTPAPAAPALFSFEEPAAETEGFSFDSETAAPQEFADETAEAAEFSFGSEPAEFSFAPSQEDPAPSFEESDEEFSLEGNGFSFDEVDTAAAPASYAANAESEAGDFDFSNMSFGDDDELPRVEPAPAAAAPAVAIAPAPRRESVTTPAAEPADRDTPLVLPPGRRQRRTPISGVLVFVILLLLGLSGAAGYFFLQGGIPDVAKLLDRLTGDGAPVVSAGQIRLTDLNGYFVDNQEVGQIFVIQGKALNDYSESRSAIAVKGVLFNKAGEPVVQQTVFSGNLLGEEALRTLPFARIEESMNNQFGDSLSNLNVAPGKSIPFTIVFRKLPVDLSEFTVEAADSRPGSG